MKAWRSASWLAAVLALPQPLLSGPPDRERRVLGIVVDAIPSPAGGRFVLKLGNGTRMRIAADGETHVRKGGQAASLDDVEVGSGVMATLKPGTVTASELAVGVFECVVTRVHRDPPAEIEVETRDGRALSLAVDDRTLIVRGPSAARAALTDIKEASIVVASLAMEDGRARALRIEIPVVGGVVGSRPLPPPPPRH
jgi:hypothetical protein